MKYLIIFIVIIGLVVGGYVYISGKNNVVIEAPVTTPIQETPSPEPSPIEVPIVQPVPKPEPVVQKPIPKPTPVVTKPTVKSYSLADISIHKDEDSCWTTISGKVYDLTSFISEHPGGRDQIIQICGKNGTAAFEGQHGGSEKQMTMLKTFYIGELK